MYKNQKIFLVFLSLTLMLFLVACQNATGLPLYRDISSTADRSEQEPTSEPEAPAAQPELSQDADMQDESATPQREGPPGRIAYIDNEGRLNTVEPDGRDRRLLSNEGERFQFPAWSSQSNQIAVIGNIDDEAVVLVYEDAEQTTPTELYRHPIRSPIYLYWQPNGENVSYIVQTREELALHLSPADGKEEGRVLATGQPFYWQWLPNNRQAMIHAGTSRLSFLDVDGTENSTGLGQNGFFQAPAISPNVRYFAYQQVDSEGRRIEIKDLAQDEIVFAADQEGVLTMSWHPERPLLAYVDPNNFASFIGPLYVWDAETGESTPLITEDVISFFWSPDGTKIAFFSLADLNQQTELNKMRLGKAAAQQRPFLTVGIADITTGAVRYLTEFSPPRLFITQFIPFFDQFALSHRLWSPDSHYLVLPSVNTQDVSQITVIPVGGGQPVQIADGVAAFWSHQ